MRVQRSKAERVVKTGIDSRGLVLYSRQQSALVIFGLGSFVSCAEFLLSGRCGRPTDLPRGHVRCCAHRPTMMTAELPSTADIVELHWGPVNPRSVDVAFWDSVDAQIVRKAEVGDVMGVAPCSHRPCSGGSAAPQEADQPGSAATSHELPRPSCANF